jgi:hypothetical protein
MLPNYGGIDKLFNMDQFAKQSIRSTRIVHSVQNIFIHSIRSFDFLLAR